LDDVSSNDEQKKQLGKKNANLITVWNRFFFLVVVLKHVFYVHPYFGEDEPNLTNIFFRWVGGSTTNQFCLIL